MLTVPHKGLPMLIPVRRPESIRVDTALNAYRKEGTSATIAGQLLAISLHIQKQIGTLDTKRPEVYVMQGEENELFPARSQPNSWPRPGLCLVDGAAVTQSGGLEAIYWNLEMISQADRSTH